MAFGYDLAPYELTGGFTVYVLVREGQEDFLAQMAGRPKTSGRAGLILTTLERIGAAGIGQSLRARFIRMLRADVGMVEVRVAGKVIRVMSYLHEGTDLVLLFDFDGHQGGNKVPRQVMEKGERLARIARACMEEACDGD